MCSASIRKAEKPLCFIDGEAGYLDSNGTIPKNLWSDDVLAEAATFLRRYHDATANLVAQSDTPCQFTHPDSTCHEVICHNDFAPWNTIFQDGSFKAIIDFDTTRPGPRIDNIAYAVYSFAPLCRPEKYAQLSVKESIDQAHKLELFCNAYGREYYEGIVDAVITCIKRTVDWVTAQAEAGDVRFQNKIKEGHVADYEADLDYLRHRKGRINHHLHQQ